MSDDRLTQQPTMLEVKATTHYYVKAPGLYHRDLGVKCQFYILLSTGQCPSGEWRYWAKKCSIACTTMLDRRYQLAIQASHMSLATSVDCHLMKLYGTVGTQSPVGRR